MSAMIYIFPRGCAARGGRPDAGLNNTTTFTVTVCDDLADLIRRSAADWGCSCDQYLAEIIEDGLVNPSGER